MPELPEVQTITSDLDHLLRNYIIKKAKIKSLYNKVLPNNELFKKYAQKKTIVGARRIAKFIVLKLDPDKFIVFHLAMTGRILLRNPNEPKNKHLKVSFELSNPDTNDTKILDFCDMRMFGKIQLANIKDIEKIKKSRGVDPLSNKLTSQKFHEKILSNKTNIKNLLLNQKIIAGIGNIYANEALFMAGIRPETNTKDITFNQANTLLKKIREVLNEGIQNRGSTMKDKMYVDIFGKEGSQQNNFRVFMQDKCKVCETPIEKIKLNGRGTYFCPNCQK